MALAPGSTLGPYEIRVELGRGGMGVVYTAHDPRLDRRVAIKVLPPDLTRDETSKQRFLQEAKTASALDHPNICTIHDVGETDDGQLYLVMAHYEGETFKQRIERGPLPVDEAVDFATQVGRGLGEAHAASIVHRDIKPANLLITEGGVVKILDFGLAKLLGTADVTQTGMALGTVAYMSPEQAKGEAVDHRTDIWSLGVVLYELLTAQPPFQGENILALAEAIRRGQPAPLTGAASAVSGPVGRALNKDAAGRYQTVIDFVSDLDPTTSAPRSARQSEVLSIAVLPFADLSPEKDQEYFCDGIAEELIDALTRLAGLQVVARTSAFQFRGQSLDLREVGGKLNVKTVLEGSVRKAGSRVRINAQLINTDDGYHIWSERFDRDLDDVFAVQEEIGEAVVQKLQQTLVGTGAPRVAVTSPHERPLRRRVHPVGPAAYEAYLKGRYHAGTRSAESLRQAVEAFREALRRDPLYAAAHAGLAECFTILATGYEEDPESTGEEAMAAAVAAVELDPDLAEAHAALGYVYFRLEWEWDKAGSCFARALQLNPGHAPTYHRYAFYLISRHRTAEAIAAISRAVLLDPVSAIMNTAKGRILYFSRDYTLAFEQYQRTLALDPSFAPAYLDLAFALAARGNYDQAVEEAEVGLARSDRQEVLTSVVGLFVGLAGHHNRARARLAALVERSTKGPVRAFHFAMIHVGLGEYDRAMDYIWQACEERDANVAYLHLEPLLDPLRSHPRYHELLRRMNFPEGAASGHSTSSTP